MLGALSISPAHLAAGGLPGPAPSPQQLWEVVCTALVVMQPTLLSCCALRLFSIWQRLGRLKDRMPSFSLLTFTKQILGFNQPRGLWQSCSSFSILSVVTVHLKNENISVSLLCRPNHSAALW